jgi:hypothetical protein
MRQEIPSISVSLFLNFFNKEILLFHVIKNTSFLALLADRHYFVNFSIREGRIISK